MRLYTNGLVRAPDGSAVRAVVVEIGGASMMVRWGSAVAWFVGRPDIKGRWKIHGLHGDQALWFEPWL